MLKHKYVVATFHRAGRVRACRSGAHHSRTRYLTRVFMLFRGVAVGDLGLWEAASERAAAVDEATFWAEVVGVDAPLRQIASCSAF